MNWHEMLTESTNGLLSFSLVFISFHFSKFYIKYYRKEDKQPAQKRERVVHYIFSMLIVFGISFFVGFLLKGTLYFGLRIFCIAIIPAIIGVKRGFEVDAKLTPSERVKIKDDIENTPQYSNSSYSDNAG